MVGEIRDSETLEVAIEASLTGHLVLSTLHTNSAVATVARLFDLGLEPYLFASSVIGIVAQRLVRRNCTACRIKVETAPTLRAMFRKGEPGAYFRGQGCAECRGTGFRGRAAIFELLRIRGQITELVLARAPERELHEAARKDGMVSLREECLALVARGETTLEEVLRVTHDWRPAAPPAPESPAPPRPRPSRVNDDAADIAFAAAAGDDSPVSETPPESAT
jgi:type IV pilus assembly protein PilB